jgi:hypothetical protein
MSPDLQPKGRTGQAGASLLCMLMMIAITIVIVVVVCLLFAIVIVGVDDVFPSQCFSVRYYQLCMICDLCTS